VLDSRTREIASQIERQRVRVLIGWPGRHEFTCRDTLDCIQSSFARRTEDTDFGNYETNWRD
jgi:hypothetical protein